MTESLCKDCEMNCCSWCDKFDAEEFAKTGIGCTDYENRPDKCKSFPWIFNPYKEQFQCLRTCPSWKEFEKIGISEEQKKIVLRLYQRTLSEYDVFRDL